MAEVQAIKNDDTIRLIGHLLSIRCHPQMADVWNIGLNLALRISDLLSIRFEDIHGDRLIIRESKTGKIANIQLNTKAQQHIARLRDQHPDHIYLFQSHRCQQLKNKPPPANHATRCVHGISTSRPRAEYRFRCSLDEKDARLLSLPIYKGYRPCHENASSHI